MKKLLYILPIICILTSCSSTKMNTSKSNNEVSNDELYSTQTIKFDIIDNDWDFARKLRNDWSFRQDFTWFAQNQDIGWYYRNYNYLGGWRSGVSPFDMYLNAPKMWFDWNMNYPFYMWNGFRNQDMLGFANTWNNDQWYRNSWGWNNSWNFNSWNGYLSGYSWNRWNRLPNHDIPNYRRNESNQNIVRKEDIGSSSYDKTKIVSNESNLNEVRSVDRRVSTYDQTRISNNTGQIIEDSQLDKDVKLLRDFGINVRTIKNVNESNQDIVRKEDIGSSSYDKTKIVSNESNLNKVRSVDRGVSTYDQTRISNNTGQIIEDSQLDKDVKLLRDFGINVRTIKNVNEARKLIPTPNTPYGVIQRPNTKTTNQIQPNRRVVSPSSTLPTEITTKPVVNNPPPSRVNNNSSKGKDIKQE